VRERRNYLLILGAIAALLVGAVLLAVPGSPAYKKPTLGLDLQGGLEVVLRAVPQKGQSIDPQQMQIAQQVITQRTNASGLVSPNIAIQGGNEIVIQLAGVHDPAKAAKTIGSTGQLQMFDFETSLLPPTVQGNQQPAPVPSLYGLLKAVQTKANKGSPQSYYLFKTVKEKVTTKVKGKKVTRTQTSHPVLQGPIRTGSSRPTRRC
jgi:preprotein translocase subunit SecD